MIVKSIACFPFLNGIVADQTADSDPYCFRYGIFGGWSYCYDTFEPNAQDFPRDYCPQSSSARPGFKSGSYISLAGGGHRAATSALGRLRGLWLLSKFDTTDPMYWPDVLAGNSGGSWALGSLYAARSGPNELYQNPTSRGPWDEFVNVSSSGGANRFNSWFDKLVGLSGRPGVTYGPPVYQSNIQHCVGIVSSYEQQCWIDWVSNHFTGDLTVDNTSGTRLFHRQSTYHTVPFELRKDIRSTPLVVATGFGQEFTNWRAQIVYSPTSVEVYDKSWAHAGATRSACYWGMEAKAPAIGWWAQGVRHIFGHTRLRDTYGLTWGKVMSRSSDAQGQTFATQFEFTPGIRARRTVYTDKIYKIDRYVDVDIVDGGALDNSAIMQGFVKQIPRMTLTINSDVPMLWGARNNDESQMSNLRKFANKCADPGWQQWKYGDVWKEYLKGRTSDQSYMLFGFAYGNGDFRHKWTTLGANYEHNQVFERKFICGVLKALMNAYDSGNGTVATFLLHTKMTNNMKEQWDVPDHVQDFPVLFTMSLSEPTRNWEEEIDRTNAKGMVHSCGRRYGNTCAGDQCPSWVSSTPFPHLHTSKYIRPECLGLLAHMETWTVQRNSKHFDQELRPEVFQQLMDGRLTDPVLMDRYSDVIDCRTERSCNNQDKLTARSATRSWFWCWRPWDLTERGMVATLPYLISISVAAILAIFTGGVVLFTFYLRRGAPTALEHPLLAPSRVHSQSATPI